MGVVVAIVRMIVPILRIVKVILRDQHSIA